MLFVYIRMSILGQDTWPYLAIGSFVTSFSVCVIAHKDPNKPVYLYCFIIHLAHLYVKFYSSTTRRTLYLHLVKVD